MAFSRTQARRTAPNPRPEELEPYMRDNPTLAKMKRLGIPLTRERYLNIIYMGEPPKPLPAEEEEQLPPPFQIRD